jgi:glycosyltransferase involved in cell wall biosynthesis
VAPLRVAFVSSGAKLGGEERYLSLVLHQLGPPWVAEVVALEDGPYVDRLRADGYSVAVLPTGRRVGIVMGAWRLRRRLRRLRPQLVHANGVKAALTCALAAPGGNPPFVWVKHDLSWDGPLARWIGRRAAAVVGVSGAVVETFGDGLDSRLRIVHNGLPPIDVDARAGRASLGGPEVGPVVVVVGRLDPAKGHREAIAALPTLRRRFPGVRLAIVGMSQPRFADYEAALRSEAEAAGVAEAVTFLGYREDATDLIAGADAVAIPTVVDSRGMGREGFSFVALEAMAVGTPVVGYAHGALPEILGDCGLLAPPGDRAALAALLEDVFAMPDLRARLADCGRNRVAAQFSLPRMIEQLQDVYRNVANAPE